VPTLEGSEKLRWNWFLAADYQGEWILTQGYAEVSESRGIFKAILLYDDESEPYHHIAARLEEENRIDAIVTSPGRDTAANTGSDQVKCLIRIEIGEKKGGIKELRRPFLGVKWGF